jgi:hypothetical protein
MSYFNQRLNMRKYAILLVLLVSLVPISHTVAPVCNVTVVDQSGETQAGILVREVWQNYTLELSGHEEDKRTDGTGVAFFPRRTMWRPYIAVGYGTLRNILSQGVHASFGPRAYLMAWGNGKQAFSDEINRKQVFPQRLVLQPALRPQ